MSRRFLVRVGVAAALLLSGLTTIGGCSNAHEPSDAQSHANNSAKAAPATMPADSAGTPGVSLEGVPTPPSGPSPEAVLAKKVCPNCGFANEPDATVCAKCGHKLD